MFLDELENMEKKEYYFREQTIVWKNQNNGDYELYISVILETHGEDRFDYAAFNYGILPEHKDWKNTKVCIHRCRMKPHEIPIGPRTFLVDYTNFHPEYESILAQNLDHVF